MGEPPRVTDRLKESITYTNSKKVNGHFVGYNTCYHLRVKPGSTYIDNIASIRSDAWDFREFVPFGSIEAYALQAAHISLDFQKNDGFELIPFLMDWDSTMLMFTKKFWEKLSYGAVTWGVLPFISECKALLETLLDLNGRIRDAMTKILNRRITRRTRWIYPSIEQTEFRYKVEGTTTVSGHLTGGLSLPDSEIYKGLILLDEFGVHPDLKTVWDVIPLSFMVDYFLPIGDMLESLHPRGWFAPTLSLSGGHSVKYTVEQFPRGLRREGDSCEYEVYLRNPGLLTLPTRPTVSPPYEAPSILELFNTVYLTQGRRKS